MRAFRPKQSQPPLLVSTQHHPFLISPHPRKKLFFLELSRREIFSLFLYPAPCFGPSKKSGFPVMSAPAIVDSPLPGRGRIGQSELAYFLKLSSSIILYSFLFLDVLDVFTVLQVCKRFAIHQSNRQLFKHAFQKKWKELGLDENWFGKLSSIPGHLFPKRFFDWKWLSKGFMTEISEENLATSIVTGRAFMKGKEEFYVGEWETGKKNGLGLQFTQTGLFFGSWKSGLFDGFGTTISSEGDTYLGDWKDNHQHGRGTKHWVGAGDCYEGEWVKDDRHGQGVYTWGSSGAKYTGGWQYGQISGHGVYNYSGGDCVYEGEWQEAKYNGKGVLTFADGEYYKGTWHQDRKQGHFESRTSFGTRYVGEYVDDEFHGTASFTHPDGYTWSGTWSHNFPESEEAHHPDILNALREGHCTRSVTQASPFYGQLLYKCSICPVSGSDKGYICANCAKSCHSGHTMLSQRIWTVGRSFCGCSPCSLLSKKTDQQLKTCAHQ